MGSPTSSSGTPEHVFLLDYHVGEPRIGDGEQEKEAHDGAGAEVEELDAEGEGHEDASREHVDLPFKTHRCSCMSKR